jgi:hypothetical protein
MVVILKIVKHDKHKFVGAEDGEAVSLMVAQCHQ